MWLAVVFLLALSTAGAEDPYRFFTWNVSYGVIRPLGVPQQGILINGQFPGPEIFAVTNDNLVINVFNNLPEPFLLSWNGMQNRKNSYQDGVIETTCPIPPSKNFTYKLQAKDQIGSYFYFPSLGLHKAAGGFGGIKILSRPRIPVPFPNPAADYTILIGDWYNKNHTGLKSLLDQGKNLPFPDGIHINGRGSGSTWTFNQGKTYRVRISNVGLENSLNFRIQGHWMKLVEVEGTHTLQIALDSLDVHVGQTYSVLVTADQPPKDYRIVVSSRFTTRVLNATAIFHYNGSNTPASSSQLPPAPTDLHWSMNQARSIRSNLTASGPRPNPQGSYKYGKINITRTIRLVNSGGLVNGKQRYAVNGVSFVSGETPLKLADYFNISGVFRVGSIPDNPPPTPGIKLDRSVMGSVYRVFVEVVFENTANFTQSWHINGYNFYVVGLDQGSWTPDSRKQYNLVDAVSRCTTQVYPNSWTAVLLSLDNVGMWNVRNEIWPLQYLGQQFYLRVHAPKQSVYDEYPPPSNVLLCGKARGKKLPDVSYLLYNL